MFCTENLSVNNSGHLSIDGMDVLELAKMYGTPLYVMSEKEIRDSCREYIKIMSNLYENFEVIYACKAFMCKEICRVIQEEGMSLDVVSGGELYTALKAGFPSSRIYFHGNDKTFDEILFAIKNDIGTIVIDSLHEAEIASGIAAQEGKTVDVLVRIKPGVEAHTHSFIKTGQLDSKFGFAIDGGEAVDVILKINQMKSLRLRGLHCHIGSQIVSFEPFVHTAKVMMDFINVLKTDLNIEICELNLGGGFGIKYLPEDTGMDYKRCLEKVSEAVHKKCKEFSLRCPKICIEPGRSIVGTSGITLYTVGNIKEIKGVRIYISVDGGMTDNPRYILYKSKYEVVNAGRMNDRKDKIVTIVGRCCESGDIIQENVQICKTEIGDILAVLCTGAYNYSMASNYNRIPKPAVVMVKGGVHKLIVNRQSYDDIVAQDL